MRWTHATFALALSLAACAPPAPPPSTPPPEVAAGTAAIRPTAALLDPYVGRYSSGADVMTIRRAGDSLVVERPGQPPLGLVLVGLGTFADAAGTAYLFTPAAGAVTRLTLVGANGTRREWAR